MSQTYRVKVKKSKTEVISSDRKTKKKVEMLELLSKEEMGKLLEEKLLEDGWEKEGEVVVKEDESCKATFDPVTHQLEIHVKIEEEVEVSCDKEEDSYAFDYSLETAEKNADKKVEEELLAELNKITSKTKNKIEEELEKNIRVNEITQEVENQIECVHRIALERKAASIGEITSIEDAVDGDLVIKVRI